MKRRLSIRILLGLASWCATLGFGSPRRGAAADAASIAGGLPAAGGDEAAAYVVAHRGASGVAPENTLAAFRRAWELGADAVEGDFWMTADGEIVCLHDRTLERTAGAKLDITTVDLKDLESLEVGAWKGKAWKGERVPTLAEVLACVPDGKRLFLEVKDGPRAVPAIRDAVRAATGSRPIKVRLIAFDEQVVRACREHLPECPVNWLVGAKTVAKRGAGAILATARELDVSGLGVDASCECLDELGAGLEAAGLELHVWTVNDEDGVRRCLETGIASITTDHPDRVRRWLPASEPVAPAVLPVTGN